MSESHYKKSADPAGPATEASRGAFAKKLKKHGLSSLQPGMIQFGRTRNGSGEFTSSDSETATSGQMHAAYGPIIKKVAKVGAGAAVAAGAVVGGRKLIQKMRA